MLFKMFGSIKNEKRNINTNGIGLGLVISKMIITKFGGTISFQSKYKRGTTFVFTFDLDAFDLEYFLQKQNKSSHNSQEENKQNKLVKLNELNHTILALDNNDLGLNFRNAIGQNIDMAHSQNRILVVDDEEFCIGIMR